MLNLSLNELKLIVKSRGIKGYKSMSEDRLLSAQNQRKKSEKNLDDTKSTRNEDYDADKALKKKTINEIRKENRDEDKILRDLDFTFYPEKIIMNLKKLLVLLIITIFNMKILEIKTKIYQSKNILILSDRI